jgi:hypothetical protein
VLLQVRPTVLFSFLVLPSYPPPSLTFSALVLVNTSSRLRSRDKHRYGTAKNLTMTVSCRRGGIFFAPQADSPGRRMRVPLLEVTCVADQGLYVCFIAVQPRPDGVLACWAHAFECESEWASRYLREEIIGACQVVFGRARRASHAAVGHYFDPVSPMFFAHWPHDLC